MDLSRARVQTRYLHRRRHVAGAARWNVAGKLLERRAEHAAGPAPGRPQVDDDRDLDAMATSPKVASTAIHGSA
jgi:hypothetical protein